MILSPSFKCSIRINFSIFIFWVKELNSTVYKWWLFYTDAIYSTYSLRNIFGVLDQFYFVKMPMYHITCLAINNFRVSSPIRPSKVSWKILISHLFCILPGQKFGYIYRCSHFQKRDYKGFLLNINGEFFMR